jgi:hypothetical protein
MPNLFYERVERHNDAAAEIEATGVTTDANAEALAGWPEFLPSTLVNLGPRPAGRRASAGRGRGRGCLRHADGCALARGAGRARDLRDTVGTIRRIDAPPGELHVRVSQPEGLPEAVAAVRALAQPVVSLTGVGASTLDVSGQGDVLIIALSEAERSATDDRTMQQSVEIVRRRVDEAGTREPTIQRQGADRILIQVPGIGSAQELKDLIGTTARLTFQPVVGRADSADEVRVGAPADPAVDGRGGGVLHPRSDAGRDGRRPDGQPAEFRPADRAAGGDVPVQPDGRAGVRRIHGGQCGRAFCHRAGRGGDLGPRDPAGDHGRVGADLGQLHGGKLHRTGGVAARGCACPPR